MENGKRKELDFEYKVQDDKECMKYGCRSMAVRKPEISTLPFTVK